MRRARLLAAPLALAVLALAVLAAGAGAPVVAQWGPLTLAVAALGGSNLAGTATLADLGEGRTRVEVQLPPDGGDHPMHVHEGPCAEVDPVPWYALANVQQGASGTDVALTVADLTQAPKSILVHRSPQDLDTYVACADIVLPAAAAGGAAPGVAVLPPGGEPALPLRPVAASVLFALGSLGLYVRRRGRLGA
jgi:hypothetical protein